MNWKIKRHDRGRRDVRQETTCGGFRCRSGKNGAQRGDVRRAARAELRPEGKLGWIGRGWWDRHGRFPEIH